MIPLDVNHDHPLRGSMRNTDEDWSILAETDPFYGVLSSEQYRSDRMNAEGHAAFFSTGRDEVEQLFDQMRKLWPDFSPGSALDFGCGVGRWLIQIAARVEKATGVDVAPAMLVQARNSANRMGLSNVSLFDVIPDQTFQWVNSFIVLQHIPPERGFPILHKLISVAEQYMSIQLPFYRIGTGVPAIMRFDGEAVDIVEDIRLPGGTMNMYDYDANRVIAAFFEGGFQSLHFFQTNHGGHIGASILARRF